LQKLILASGSQYRQTQLRGLGLPFICQPAQIDESPFPGESPSQTANRLALYKAEAVALCFPEAIIIGCDQTGELDGALLNKPGHHMAALQQLRAMAGKTVHFHSALVVIAGDWQSHDCVTTDVTLRDLTEHEIERYLLRDTPYDCAGSFKIESAGSVLMQSVRSDDPSALIGLPLIRLCQRLREIGIDPCC
jgi:septum formation protein